jgi:transglutaminase-like putative cysteine protease
MNHIKFGTLLSIFFLNITFSQEYNFNSNTIPQNLKQDAHSVVLFNNIDIQLNSSKSIIYTVQHAVTVLNNLGNENRYVAIPYDPSRRIKKVTTIVYDAVGNEIKKVKNKEYKDISQVDSGTLFDDNRMLYFEYIPSTYPYTIYYEYEIESSNTAFIPNWNPLLEFETGLIAASYKINYEKNLSLTVHEKNFKEFNIEKSENDQQLFYKISNIEPISKEPLSVSLKKIMPTVKVASNKFFLEGKEGEASNWLELGKWEYENLYSNIGNLPQATVDKIKMLVKDAKSDLEKAKIIYQYVQDKTRYISVQVGIGGLKPMLAADVDRLGYGDCKALTNYTKSLLNAVGVESYFTELYGSNERLNMDFNLPSIQGNHVILNLPSAEGDVWLECTSQLVPFGYIANFTDDREVIVIKPEGGELKKTTAYKTQNNLQISKGSFSINHQGTIDAKIKIESFGTQYNDNLHRYDGKNLIELNKLFKRYFSIINNINFSKIEVVNHKEAIKYEENLIFSATNYASISGNQMFININAFNRNADVVKRVRNRKLPFEIERGYIDIDEVEIKLPSNFEVEYIPVKKEINSKFGTYTMDLIKLNDTTYLYKRKITIEPGEYAPNDYEDYRNFKTDINLSDNSKIILKQKKL